MKTAVKVLSIIALIIGIIWAFVGFFGSWLGGAIYAASQSVGGEIDDASKTISSTAINMIKLIFSFIIVIIAGVLGIVGSDKKPARIKSIVLGSIIMVCGASLFPLNNWIAAVLYVISGLILIISGAVTKVKKKV